MDLCLSSWILSKACLQIHFEKRIGSFTKLYVGFYKNVNSVSKNLIADRFFSIFFCPQFDGKSI